MQTTIQWLFRNLLTSPNTPELVAGIAVLILVAWVAIRANKIVDQKAERCIEQDARISLLEKQQHKIICIINRLPIISKDNATWLQDAEKNGGKPPDDIVCLYEGRTDDD